MLVSSLGEISGTVGAVSAAVLALAGGEIGGFSGGLTAELADEETIV